MFCSGVFLGYLPYAGSGLNGRGFKNAISKWYSTRNTLETMKLIMESKHFHNMTHKRVLENIRYFTDDPGNFKYLPVYYMI